MEEADRGRRLWRCSDEPREGADGGREGGVLSLRVRVKSMQPPYQLRDRTLLGAQWRDKTAKGKRTTKRDRAVRRIYLYQIIKIATTVRGNMQLPFPAHCRAPLVQCAPIIQGALEGTGCRPRRPSAPFIPLAIPHSLRHRDDDPRKSERAHTRAAARPRRARGHTQIMQGGRGLIGHIQRVLRGSWCRRRAAEALGEGAARGGGGEGDRGDCWCAASALCCAVPYVADGLSGCAQ